MNFQETYSRTAYLDFFRDRLLPDDFETAEESIDLGFKTSYTTDAIKIGEVPSLDLPVFEIKHKSENDPRVSISKEAFRILANYGRQQALILFISTKAANYRLSLVTLDLKLEGKRVTKEFSNPRRYSFFLGPQCKVHTPEQYLSKRITDMDDLKNRFSIEVVNKEFFTQIALLFTQLTGGSRKIGSKKYEEKGCLTLPQTTDDTIKKEFTVRLIGRLIFCWFLKKKTSKAEIPLIPEDILSVNTIDKVKNNPDYPGGYYHGILEPLFFEVLNTPVADRKKKFKNGPWNKIPFLNGGLFTPHLHDFYEVDDLSHSLHINTLKVPDKWINELLEIFERYNFTIDENTPVDVELAIEPEMLGRIFENLLAEINPETGETARKATGSYYTPRPIVEYMVDESLKQYLITKTGITEDKIASLLSYSDEDGSKFTEKQTESLVATLHAVKIIDPACGSGAFPLGILQKILLMLQKLDPDSKIWLEKMLANIPDPMYRKELKKKRIPNYLHKLGIIKDCIFGVDIQPIAVEISKLRCFLSLIVDEKVDDDADNRGIEHLPNLEFKFVCANTLIGLPEKTQKEKSKKGTFDQVQLFEATDKIDELKELRDLYLTSYGSEKKKIETRFRKVQSEMFQHDLDMGGQAKQTAKLAQWNPFSDEASSWFDTEWMFGIKNGFDIVLGNPPWGQKSVKFSTSEIQYFKKMYPAATKGILDIFRLFIEKSVSMTSKNGVFTNVLPDIVLLKNYDSTRKYLLDILSLKNIDHWGMAFEDVNMDICTIIGQKTYLPDNIVMTKIHKKEAEVYNEMPQSQFLKNDGYKFNLFIDHGTLTLIDKIKKHGQFGDFFEPHEGIHSGNIRNKLFVDKKENKFSKKLILGRKEVQRFHLSWAGKWVNYNPEIINKNEGEYAGLGRPEYFECPKIVVRRTGDFILAAYDDEAFYFSNNVFVCSLRKNVQLDLKYALGILNSKLSTWYYRKIQPRKGKLFAELKINVLKTLPMMRVPTMKQNEIATLVDAIILSRQHGETTTKYEDDLDIIIYKLFNLAKEEINIIQETD